MLQKERIRAIFDEEKSFSDPMWIFTSGLLPFHFAQMLQKKKVRFSREEGVQEKKGSREEGGCANLDGTR